jgi:hypothetical protein
MQPASLRRWIRRRSGRRSIEGATVNRKTRGDGLTVYGGSESMVRNLSVCLGYCCSFNSWFTKQLPESITIHEAARPFQGCTKFTRKLC